MLINFGKFLSGLPFQWGCELFIFLQSLQIMPWKHFLCFLENFRKSFLSLLYPTILERFTIRNMHFDLFPKKSLVLCYFDRTISKCDVVSSKLTIRTLNMIFYTLLRDLGKCFIRIFVHEETIENTIKYRAKNYKKTLLAENLHCW